MTRRELFTATIAALASSTAENAGALADAFADELLKMDKRNSDRRNKPTKAALENAPLADFIVSDVLSDEPKTTADICAAMLDAFGTVSIQKVSAIMRQLVANGLAVEQDVRVPSKGTRKAFTLAQ